jgi:radical SAM superfamily enzyme YgiQ (UPF0313 family)
MRVLLISPNRLRFPYPVYPIGLDYVAGTLAVRHDVRLLDLCPLEEHEIDEALSMAVAQFAPEVVGISIRNLDNLEATRPRAFMDDLRRVTGRIRSSTSAPIVLGGSGFSLFPAELLDLLEADYGIVGEGERALPLMDAIEAGDRVVPRPGLAVRGRPLLSSNFETGHRAARRLTPRVNPAFHWYLEHGAILGLQTQCGCAMRCIYCTYPILDGGRTRLFAPDSVALEARQLEDAGAGFVVLTDSVFNAVPEHSLAVAEAFSRAGLKTPWGAFFAPLSPPEGFYEQMARGGCTHVEFGTDSLCDPMLRRLRKGFSRADALEAHRAALAAGLHVAHFLLLGGPDETPDTVDETLDACAGLERTALFFFCGMRICPGTELESIARATGQISPEQSLLQPVFYEPAAISLAEIADRVQRRAAGRLNWNTGSGSDRAAGLVSRLHGRGHKGPLWERLAEA